VRHRLGEERFPLDACGHACDSALGVDLHILHPSGADQDSVDHSLGGSVPGRLHSDRKAVFGGPPDRGCDIGSAGRPDNHIRLVHNSDVVASAVLGKLGITFGEDGTPDS
jgi:hypothetical protein